ncbi:unnamed protein product, partial [Brassica rapa]
VKNRSETEEPPVETTRRQSRSFVVDLQKEKIETRRNPTQKPTPTSHRRHILLAVSPEGRSTHQIRPRLLRQRTFMLQKRPHIGGG